MKIEIHLFRRESTGETDALRAEVDALRAEADALRSGIAALRARLAAEVPSAADLATLDALIDKVKSLASDVDKAIAEDDALRRDYRAHGLLK
jgi:prefoldin subunit 5